MNERIVRRYAVMPDRAGERFDVVATALLGDYSREQIKRWIQSGELTLDGARASASTRISGDECIDLDALLIAREDWQTPQHVPFTVVHEDGALLIIDKPPGVVVHPGAGTADGTLVNGLLHAFPELVVVPRAGIVHRLDKDTSGLMLIARRLEVHARLVKMIAAREVGRRYLVLVHGVVAHALSVDAPIGRHPRARTSMAVIGSGRPALTDFRPIATARGMTLLEAQLSTGRTHQIRVHLAHAGYPVVGDARYGRAGTRVPMVEHAAPDEHAQHRVGSAPSGSGSVADSSAGVSAGARSPLTELLARQALHAWRLTLPHPTTGQMLTVHALPPPDFAALLASLGLLLPEATSP